MRRLGVSRFQPEKHRARPEKRIIVRLESATTDTGIEIFLDLPPLRNLPRYVSPGRLNEKCFTRASAALSREADERRDESSRLPLELVTGHSNQRIS